MQYHFCHKTWQAYVLNLSNNFIRRVFAQNLFISLKLSTKSFLKIQLVLALLLLLPYSLESQALSATTSNTIQGTAPYLTLDDGVTKETNIDSLLAIKLSDGRTFTPQNNPSSPTATIKVPVEYTWGNINIIVPPSREMITMDELAEELVAQGKLRDDDGDLIMASGGITLSILDKNGQWINSDRNNDSRLTICGAPYAVKLDSPLVGLFTMYGDPSYSILEGGSVTYYISPNTPPQICSVKPNLVGGLDGLGDIWNYKDGFFVQSTNPDLYNLNFPTTGAHNLYFDLLIGGVDESQLTWSPVTLGGITATVTKEAVTNGGVEKIVTRVKLTGPAASDSQKESDSPGRIAVPDLPQVFKLEGRDSSGNVVVKYGFKLKQWFVARGNKLGTFSEQESWCNSIGYRLPRISDLTNAKCGIDDHFPCVEDINGAAPLSIGNNSQRRIGAGLFTEWGVLLEYTDADLGFQHWTSDIMGNNPFLVYEGVVTGSYGIYDASAICTF
ncbi:hypothetical protein [Gilliamella sp. Occ4-3]|uniref:hypothetical protein n=1 Tax=Gilliamella sp. Occ4-3 TaxID=3120254 RepID=UPI00080DAFB6|nr:hypothetical protein [Gilliamella apicola]OCG75935.1 hypothetical protein A9G44_07095 [Gilliamella apicola]